MKNKTKKSKSSYYAVIPAKIRYCKDLNGNEKLIYGEITALSNKKGYCYATNRYFAELYDVTKITISRYISKLRKLGFIKIQYIKKNKEIKQRRIRLLESIPINKNDNRGINKNVKENNTSKNSTSKNKRKQIKESFKKFWDSYDYKIDKPRCKKYWLGESKLKNGEYMDDAMRKECLDAVPKYVKNTYKDKYPTRKHPATYLYNSSWENEVVEIDKDNGVYKEEGYEPGF